MLDKLLGPWRRGKELMEQAKSIPIEPLKDAQPLKETMPLKDVSVKLKDAAPLKDESVKLRHAEELDKVRQNISKSN